MAAQVVPHWPWAWFPAALAAPVEGHGGPGRAEHVQHFAWSSWRHGIHVRKSIGRSPDREGPEGEPGRRFSDIDSVVGQTTKIFLGGREPMRPAPRAAAVSRCSSGRASAPPLEVNQVSGVRLLPG
jgi:hypothetical protein